MMQKPSDEHERYLDMVATELYQQLRLFHLTDPIEFEAKYLARMLAAYFEVATKNPVRSIGKFTIISVPKSADTQTISQIIKWMKQNKMTTASFYEWERQA